MRIQADGEAVVVELRDGVVTPAGMARLVLDSRADTGTGQALKTVFEASSLIGVERLVKLAAFAQGIVNWFSGDGVVQLPSSSSTTVAAPRPRLMWPPPEAPGLGEYGQSGLGKWRSPEGLSPESALMLTTEVLVNVGGKSQSVSLFAFDMRRLGLGYVAGTHEPRSQSGIRGDGRIPECASAATRGTHEWRVTECV